MRSAIKTQWEHGSEFHWLSFQANYQQVCHPWKSDASFFGSGRDALRSLLLFGQQGRGWKRIWIPSYFCYDVVEAISSTNIEICIYPDSMAEEKSCLPLGEIASKDVILLVNFFGMRNKPIFPSDLPREIEVIEDHTHDPWSVWAQTSQAEFCFASLRKTIPVPDGGVLWSPKKLAIPLQPSITKNIQEASAAKLSSMLLKSLYLKGCDIEKECFRKQAIKGENQISSGEISGMTEASKIMIDCFPLLRWRKKRQQNFRFLVKKIKDISWCCVPKLTNNSNCPFSVVLLVDTAKRRENLLLALVKRNIYPAVLWSLEKSVTKFTIPNKHLELSRKMLSLHCDMRYNNIDMQRVAEAIISLESVVSG